MSMITMVIKGRYFNPCCALQWMFQSKEVMEVNVTLLLANVQQLQLLQAIAWILN